MTLLVSIRLVVGFIIAVGFILVSPAGSAIAEYEFSPESFRPEEVFVPVGMTGPPSEEQFRVLLDAGYITQLGFEKAMASLHAIEHGHFQWYVGVVPFGSMEGMGPLGMMGPPTEAQLNAEFEAGNMSQEEYQRALEGLRQWEAAADNPDKRQALMHEFGGKSHNRYGDAPSHGMKDSGSSGTLRSQ